MLVLRVPEKKDNAIKAPSSVQRIIAIQLETWTDQT